MINIPYPCFADCITRCATADNHWDCLVDTREADHGPDDDHAEQHDGPTVLGDHASQRDGVFFGGTTSADTSAVRGSLSPANQAGANPAIPDRVVPSCCGAGLRAWPDPCPWHPGGEQS